MLIKIISHCDIVSPGQKKTPDLAVLRRQIFQLLNLPHKNILKNWENIQFVRGMLYVGDD